MGGCPRTPATRKFLSKVTCQRGDEYGQCSHSTWKQMRETHRHVIFDGVIGNQKKHSGLKHRTVSVCVHAWPRTSCVGSPGHETMGSHRGDCESRPRTARLGAHLVPRVRAIVVVRSVHLCKTPVSFKVYKGCLRPISRRREEWERGFVRMCVWLHAR